MTTAPAPTILKTSGTADFLATLPAIAGFTARNSIVVALFRGKRSCGAIRIDLPPDCRSTTVRALGDTIVRSVATVRGVEGIAPVVYTDESFSAANGVPHLELWRGLELRLRRSGLRIVDAACVASDGWASYLERNRPLEGHRLELIRESRLALEAALLVDELPDITAFSILPAADPRVAPLVAAQLDDLMVFGDRLDSFGIAHQVGIDSFATSDDWLGIAADDLPPSVLAQIIATAHTPATRDALLLTLAFGCEVGERALESDRRTRERSARTGETFDEIAVSKFTAGQTSDDDLLMLGRSIRRPDTARLLASIRALRRAGAHAPRFHRAGVLCLLSWMLWARGLVSAAEDIRLLARECDPDLRMVETLEWIMNAGPPRWAVDAFSNGRPRVVQTLE